MVVSVPVVTNKKMNVNRTVEFTVFGRDLAVSVIMVTWDSAVESKRICQQCLR